MSASKIVKDATQHAEPVLNKTLIDYMKLIEKENLVRVQRLQKIKRRNLFTGIGIGIGVLSIYGYSIYATKQETFLDDFNEPPLVEVPSSK